MRGGPAALDSAQGASRSIGEMGSQPPTRLPRQAVDLPPDLAAGDVDHGDLFPLDTAPSGLGIQTENDGAVIEHAEMEIRQGRGQLSPATKAAMRLQASSSTSSAVA